LQKIYFSIHLFRRFKKKFNNLNKKAPYSGAF
jgi:hypothetical protein